MTKLHTIDYLALILVIVGGLNWGLVGVLNFDLVAGIFGHMTVFARIIYTIVGLGAIAVLFHLFKGKHA